MANSCHAAPAVSSPATVVDKKTVVEVTASTTAATNATLERARSANNSTAGRQRKQRTITPYFRKFDGWWYACSKNFLPLYGRERVKLLKGPKTKANQQAAVVELAKIMQRLEVESLADDMTIGNLAEEYLTWKHAQNHTDGNTKAVTAIVQNFCEYFGNQTVVEFSRLAARNVDRWIAANSVEGKGKYCWVSGSARHRAIVTIKSMFNHGCKYLNLTKSPIGIVELPEREVRLTYFNEEQEKAILETLQLDRFVDAGEFADFFTACIETGGRTFVETAQFSADKIEWEDGQPVVVDCGVVKRRQRYIYLSPTMQTLVKRLVEKYPSGALFRNSTGSAWGTSTAARRLRGVIRYLMTEQPELGLTKDHTLYSCRHSYIVRKLIEAKDVALVAEMAGNSIAVLEKHYKKWGASRGRIMEALHGKPSPSPLKIADVA